jgi:hypothetical protein
MRYLIGAFLIASISHVAFGQAFPDQIILIKGDTLESKIGMINAQNVFTTTKTYTKKGKSKAKDLQIPLSEIQAIKLVSNATISNKNYHLLINKFQKEFLRTWV